MHASHFTRPARLYMLLLCFFGVVASLRGQETFTGYVEPSLSLNYSLGGSISQNLSVGHRLYYHRGGTSDFGGRQLDLALFTGFEFLGNQSLGLGVQYRFRNPFEPGAGNELRITEQYNVTSRPRTIRFGHRFRIEQRIRSVSTIHRFRYRFALDGPLQGDRTDVGEFYWVGTAEQVLSVGRAQSAEWDVRTAAQIGYLLNRQVRTQLGLEYRLEDFNHGGDQELFFNMALILAL